MATFEKMLTFTQDQETHNHIIAVTVIYYQAKLITRHKLLQNLDEIDTIWDEIFWALPKLVFSAWD